MLQSWLTRKRPATPERDDQKPSKRLRIEKPDDVVDEKAQSTMKKSDSGSHWMAGRPRLLKELESKTYQVASDGSLLHSVGLHGKENVPSTLFEDADRSYLRKPNQMAKRPWLDKTAYVEEPKATASTASLAPSGAVEMVYDILRLLFGSIWKHKPAQQCIDVVKDYGKRCTGDSLLAIAREEVEHWEVGAWDMIRTCMSTNNLPKYRRSDRSKGLYLDIVNVVALKGHGPHNKVYGGMGAGIEGLDERIRHHESTAFRLRHPSLHYTFVDTPGATSTYFTFAHYPSSFSIPRVLIGESIMISALGLYESPSVYELLATHCRVPMCLSGRHSPIIGLNSEPGLVFSGWNDAQASEARTKQFRDKAIKLITTGYSFAITPSKTSQTTFNLMRQHRITLTAVYKERYPAITKVQSATAFIELQPGVKHPHAFYQFDSLDPELQQWGLWIDLGDQHGGFWMVESRAMVSAKTSAKKVQERMVNSKALARCVSEEYGLSVRGT